MKISFFKIIALASIFLPNFVFAQMNVNIFIARLIQIIIFIIPILIGIALISFIYGIIRYVIVPEQKKDSLNIIVYSLIIMFAMVAVWGLVWMLLRTFLTYIPVMPRTGRFLNSLRLGP